MFPSVSIAVINVYIKGEKWIQLSISGSIKIQRRKSDDRRRGPDRSGKWLTGKGFLGDLGRLDARRVRFRPLCPAAGLGARRAAAAQRRGSQQGEYRALWRLRLFHLHSWLGLLGVLGLAPRPGRGGAGPV